MKSSARPSIVVLAGPNGSGKSTIAPLVLWGELRVTEFISADVIAEGLSAFAPETAAIAAGRIMRARSKELAARRASFALETTLASRSLAPWIASLGKVGYTFHLVFLWLPSADVAVARVAERVRVGGHHVPDDIVRRRHDASLRNFFRLYRPLSSLWRVLDNSGLGSLSMLASGSEERTQDCSNRSLWSSLESRYGRE